MLATTFLNNLNLFKIPVCLISFDLHNIVGDICPSYQRHGEKKDTFKFTKSINVIFL